MFEKRWLQSPDGRAFVRIVSELLEDVRNSSGATATQLGAGEAADWVEIKNDYLTGLRVSSPVTPSANDEALFLKELDRVYYLRFHDGYSTLDTTKVLAQAIVLGNITGLMLQLHRGMIGKYPNQVPAAPLTTYYLDWARDFIGFWVYGHYHYSIKPHSRLEAFSVVPVEFDNGCVFC